MSLFSNDNLYAGQLITELILFYFIFFFNGHHFYFLYVQYFLFILTYLWEVGGLLLFFYWQN